MTGEQKPGGLEVVAFRWKGFDGYYVVGLGQPKPFDAEPLTPAEPAEARVRELTERVEYLRKSRDGHAAASHAEFEKRVAAEAQLAKAKEALEPFATLAGKFGCWSVVEVSAPDPDNPSPVIAPVPLSAFENASAVLAALQQAGEVG